MSLLHFDTFNQKYNTDFRTSKYYMLSKGLKGVQFLAQNIWKIVTCFTKKKRLKANFQNFSSVRGSHTNAT